MSDDEYDPEPLSPDEVAFGRLMLVAGKLQRMSAYAPTGDAAAEVAHVARHFYPSERRREIAAAERRGAERMRLAASRAAEEACWKEAAADDEPKRGDYFVCSTVARRAIVALDVDAVLAEADDESSEKP